MSHLKLSPSLEARISYQALHRISEAASPESAEIAKSLVIPPTYTLVARVPEHLVKQVDQKLEPHLDSTELEVVPPDLRHMTLIHSTEPLPAELLETAKHVSKMRFELLGLIPTPTLALAAFPQDLAAFQALKREIYR